MAHGFIIPSNSLNFTTVSLVGYIQCTMHLFPSNVFAVIWKSHFYAFWEHAIKHCYHNLISSGNCCSLLSRKFTLLLSSFFYLELHNAYHAYVPSIFYICHGKKTWHKTVLHAFWKQQSWEYNTVVLSGCRIFILRCVMMMMLMHK